MPSIRLMIAVSVIAATLIGPARAQAPQPDGGGVRPGDLPRRWLPSGPECPPRPEFQVHAYNDDFYILRESGCSNYEKPFLFLLFGQEKALLFDTGAGQTDVAEVVATLLRKRAERARGGRLPLVVAHTHAHGDHVSGDASFGRLAATTVVGTSPQAVQQFFGFHNWPDETITYDLGGRILDIIPIPGHEPSSIAVYDRETGVLLTGDTLYPGRLYVRDSRAFVTSIERLVAFTRGKIITHVLGNHIENTRTPYLDYPVRTIYQPEEHDLALGRAHLVELNEALADMKGTIVRRALRDFTIWPQ